MARYVIPAGPYCVKTAIMAEHCNRRCIDVSPWHAWQACRMHCAERRHALYPPAWCLPLSCCNGRVKDFRNGVSAGAGVVKVHNQHANIGWRACAGLSTEEVYLHLHGSPIQLLQVACSAVASPGTLISFQTACRSHSILYPTSFCRQTFNTEKD